MGTVWFSVANSSRGAPPVKAALSSTGFAACDLMKASAARSAKGAGNGLSAIGRATDDAVMAHAFGRWKTGKRPCRYRSEENTSELQSLMRTSDALFCLKTKN